MPYLAGTLALVLLAAAEAAPTRPFVIEVVDQETGRGVPLVELKTVNQVRLYTDSAGIVAFDEPGLMDQEVFFFVASHGYEFPQDGFGFRGARLKVTAGGHARLTLKRINVAQRLYRVTGEGIYRDSVLAGRPVPIRRPLLNAQVLGSDSVMNAVYHGRIYWFWGDTNRPGYPLGNFHVPGAVSDLPGHGGLDPEKGIDLEYFVDETGFAKPTARFPGEGPTWISGPFVLSDAGGERMFAHYVKVRGQFEVYERGLAEFDDHQKQFRKVAAFPADGPFPHGAHTLLYTAGGKPYVYFCTPYAQVRVPADPEAIERPDRYEAFTCLAPGSRIKEKRLDRNPDGSLRYAWKADTDPVGPQEQADLVRAGTMPAEDALLALRDVDSGKPIFAHRGSVCWNAYRRRYVMIFCQQYGTSLLGETWYAEADRPLGPWVYARKIVTHDRYSFYNPKQHAMFDEDGGRRIFFEGTYTCTFSGNEEPTPRYDYNQVLYMLDLDDPRLNLPVAVYEWGEPGDAAGLDTAARKAGSAAARPVAFWALERPGAGADGTQSEPATLADGTRSVPATLGTVPVYAVRTPDGATVLQVGIKPGDAEKSLGKPIFYALSSTAGTAVAHDGNGASAAIVGLYEFRAADGRRAYATADRAAELPGWVRAAKPIALVWRHPLRRSLLVGE